MAAERGDSGVAGDKTLNGKASSSNSILRGVGSHPVTRLRSEPRSLGGRRAGLDDMSFETIEVTDDVSDVDKSPLPGVSGMTAARTERSLPRGRGKNKTEAAASLQSAPFARTSLLCVGNDLCEMRASRCGASRRPVTKGGSFMFRRATG